MQIDMNPNTPSKYIIFLAQKYPFHLRLSAQPPISPPRGPKEAVFGLQLICPENHQITLHSKHTEHSDAYWTPIAVYYSLKTKKYIIVRLPTIEIDVCPLTDCLEKQVKSKISKLYLLHIF
jgi:hypothetical protein